MVMRELLVNAYQHNASRIDYLPCNISGQSFLVCMTDATPFSSVEEIMNVALRPLSSGSKNGTFGNGAKTTCLALSGHTPLDFPPQTWLLSQINGKWCGARLIFPKIEEGYSTTNLIEKIKRLP